MINFNSGLGDSVAWSFQNGEVSGMGADDRPILGNASETASAKKFKI